MGKTIALLVLALYAPLATAMYKCVDDKGRTLVGDTPPSGCGDVPIYEVTRSGMVLRRIDPSLTPEQAKQREAEAARKKAEQLAAVEQKRKDMALLASYSDAKEFDVARERNLEPVNARIAGAESRLKELDAHEKDVKQQKEFYKGGKSKRTKEAGDPADDQTDRWFQAELDRVQKERTTLIESIVRYKKEIAELTARYEADKQRWIALKAGGGTIRTQARADALEPPAKPKTY